MCGGSGPRLWPLSRSPRPKQFLKLFTKRSLIQETVARFCSVVPPQNIYIISHQKYLSQLKNDLGNVVPFNNYISEPQKKNTALAVLYGTTIIKSHHPTAIITVSPSDHYVGNIKNFKKDLTKSYRICSNNKLIVTIGIRPTHPNPGFGYILSSNTKDTISMVNKFIEKPTEFDAQILIKKGALWNAGIYTYDVSTMLNEFQKYQPNYFNFIEKLTKNHQSVKQVYLKSDTLPIDKAISEKSKILSIIPATFNWSDVGEWYAIWQHLSTKSQDGIVHLGNQGKHVSVNSKNCLLFGPPRKLTGLVGLNNLAIIDTPDSLLVCNLHDTYAVRNLVTQIVENPELKKYFLNNHVSQ